MIGGPSIVAAWFIIPTADRKMCPFAIPNGWRKLASSRLSGVSVALGFITSSPASAADSTTDTIEQVRNHISCYPFGLDKIGAGDHAAGMAILNKCYATDFKFRVEVPGRTVTCPGDGCPFPKDTDPISMRAAFAESEYRSYKFIRTSHHLTNIQSNEQR
jgi:hypothetical protein